MYLVTEELLVDAHESPEGTGAAAWFVAGFLVFLPLGWPAHESAAFRQMIRHGLTLSRQEFT